MYRILFLIVVSIGLVACNQNDRKVAGWEINDVYHSTIISPNLVTGGKTFQGPPINTMDEANTYEMFSLRADQSKQGVKTFQLLAQLTYFSQWRYYDAATLAGKPASTFNVISRDAGACGDRGCIFRELLSIELSDAFIKEHKDKGFQIRISSKSGLTSVLYVPPEYLKGYLMAVDGTK